MARDTLSTYAISMEAFSRLLRGWMHEDDVSQEDLAEATATQQQKVSGWVSPKSDMAPSIVRVRHFPRELARRALQWAAEPHHLLVIDKLAPDADAKDHFTHLSRMLRESGDLTSEYAAALRDGVVDADERRRVLKEARELRDATASLITQLEGDESRERALTKPVALVDRVAKGTAPRGLQ